MVSEFRAAEKPLLVKCSGKVLSEERMGEIASMHRNGRRIVLVHGGGAQIDESVRSELRQEPEFDRKTGLRLTDWKTMAIVADVIDWINRDVVSALSGMGIAAAGFNLEKSIFQGLALEGRIGRYGRITSTDALGVMQAVLEGRLAVVAPVGRDLEGGELNLNADDAAVELARELGLGEVVFLTKTKGILGAGGKEVREIRGKAGFDAFCASNPVGKGMVEKAYACRLALGYGIGVRISSGLVEDALAHSLDGNPFGTTVRA
ncbi:Amino-acid acetyltransferase [uncultured archaeon]|nr:Amino-acid acetyltransferase [uncultured archaeon]